MQSFEDLELSLGPISEFMDICKPTRLNLKT
jgi:hypothetical protein